MKLTTVLLALLALSAFLSGCVQVPKVDTKPSNQLTSGQVSLTLRKNQTTQTQVLEAFGAPNLVTSNADGEEAWTYQRHATVTNSSSTAAFATIILAGVQTATSGLEQSSRTMTLIIKFREINGVKTIVDFSSRASSF